MRHLLHPQKKASRKGAKVYLYPFRNYMLSSLKTCVSPPSPHQDQNPMNGITKLYIGFINGKKERRTNSTKSPYLYEYLYVI